ncbi:phosphotransferase [Agromyces cerinus]|nr:phosphotransferase [Agromyces cerinus]
MRTPPDDLDPRALARVLGDEWGFEAVDLDHVPLGFGSHHWRATDASGARRFVTVDDLGAGEAGTREVRLARLARALETAGWLRDRHGLEFVVAPLPPASGAVPTTVGERWAATVFPWLEVGTEAVSAATALDLLVAMHSATGHPPAVRDDLVLQDRHAIDRAMAELDAPWSGGPYSEPARRALAAVELSVRAALERYDASAAAIIRAGEPWVVTHGEPKAGNLVETSDGPKLVDWDTALVAPAARDLCMLDDAVVERYRRLTGRAVPATELDFYRLRWDLTDISSYVPWFRRPHSVDADLQIAWTAFSGLLAPGGSSTI